MNAEAALAANIQIMQLTTSCWTSRCLHVVAELGIADLIGDQPQSTEALAKASGTQPNAIYRVLRLLASVGIFEWEHGAWHHTDASRLLRSDQPGSLRDYLRMLGLPVFWNAFADLDHSLRTGKSAFANHHPEGVFEYLAKHPEKATSSTRLWSRNRTAISQPYYLHMISRSLLASLTSLADVATCCGQS